MNDIIVQFSTSVYKPGETLPEGKSVGDFKDYHAVVGTTINDEYNETLDSAVIVLSQVSLKDRLVDLTPYTMVRVVDAGNLSFENVYLIDTFNETENNIKEHIFGYTIHLMSETKWLEKIQCPNLTITHDVNPDGTTTAKTIYQKIFEYAELFIPKVKMAYDDNGTIKWHYEPLIKVQSSLEIDDTAVNNDYQNNKIVVSDFSSTNLYFNFKSGVSSCDTFSISYQGYDWYGSGPTFRYTYRVTNNSEHTITIPANFYFGSQRMSLIYTTRIKNTTELVIPSGEYREFIVRSTHGSELVDLTTRTYSFGTNESIIVTGDNLADNSFFSRFNVRCADMSFSAPTLRQLFTTLMQQVGCIPVVKNRTLGYLDFQKNAVDFGGPNHDYTLNNTVNRISRSLSSDSYVNTLVNISNQVLDSGNEVVSETLCFRDSSNVLLRQQQNLYLETSLPIYKINKTIMHAPGKSVGYINSNCGCIGDKVVEQPGSYGYSHTLDPNDFPAIYYGKSNLIFSAAGSLPGIDNDASQLQLKFYMSNLKVQGTSDPVPAVISGVTVSNIKVTFLAFVDNKIQVTQKTTIPDFVMRYDNTVEAQIQLSPTSSSSGSEVLFRGVREYETRTSIFNIKSDMCWVSGTFTNNYNGKTQDFVFFKFATGANEYNYIKLYYKSGGTTNSLNNSQFALLDLNALGFFVEGKWDLTPLVVENSVREQLSRNYVKMGQEINIANRETITPEKLGKYVYGTVGYSIGSKRISGFSEIYYTGEGTALGWIQKDYTYIENIVSALAMSQESYEKFSDLLGDFPIKTIETNSYSDVDTIKNNTLINGSFKYYNPNSSSFGDKPFFTTFFFDIYYQPLNSFNLSYVKSQEQVDYTIEQYDSNASGVTDFDRLSINEQEQVDRIGNEVLSINQRTNNIEDIKDFKNGPLFYKEDTNRNGSIDSNDNGIQYIIFKRSFSIKNNYFNANYVGSKDAVLKDYFTSIRTKYRAYQYSDFGQTTIRKEKDVIFVRIAKDRYDGDNKIWIGPYSSNDRYNLSDFIYDIYGSNNKKISYECEQDTAKVWSDSDNEYINQEQTIKNSVSTVVTSNTLAFIYEYVDYIGAGTYIKDISAVSSFSNDEKLGGIPQSWQIWGGDYKEKHTVSFVSEIPFYNFPNLISGFGNDYLTNYFKKIQRSPIVAIPSESFIDLSTSTSNQFSICDDNTVLTNGKAQRTFFKDTFEIINHTVEFIYYAPDKDILFGEDFISGSPLVGKFDNIFNAIVVSNQFICDTNKHDFNSEVDNIIAISSSSGFPTNWITQDENSITIHWRNRTEKVMKLCYIKSGYSVDIVAFKREGNEATTTYYFSFNDTKSDYVLAEKDGILYRRYKVQTYTVGQNQPRTVIDLYSEPEEE